MDRQTVSEVAAIVIDAKAMSDMLRVLNWKTLEDRRKISRLTLFNKSVHNIVAINIDEHYTNHEKRNITTRKTSSISFTHPTARKNC